MKTQIEKLTGEFVNNLLQVVLGNPAVPSKPRGLAALPIEERRAVARKAATTRKRRAAARKAVATRQRNAQDLRAPHR